MDSIHKLEDNIQTWLKPLPHLPKNWCEWIAKNVWWITLIGVILSALGALALVGAIMSAGTIVSVYGVYGDSILQTQTGLWMTASVISLAFLVLTVVITAMAISPLKALSKKGWDLLFLVYLLGIASQVVGAVVSVFGYTGTNFLSGIIGAIISAVIGAYFLFEIRSHFKHAS